MKTLEELNLKPKDLRKVKRWLESWVEHFTRMAQGAVGSIERYNLEKLDFFYFTDCRDILSKKPESLGVEDNESIIKRKKAIEYGLVFRFLLGEKFGRQRTCSHCGHHDRWINSLGDGTGHYLYCPKCKMTSIITYPVGYNTCIGRVTEDLVKHGFDDPFMVIRKKEPHKCRCKEEKAQSLTKLEKQDIADNFKGYCKKKRAERDTDA